MLTPPPIKKKSVAKEIYQIPGRTDDSTCAFQHPVAQGGLDPPQTITTLKGS